jgi:hypothetical protein
LLICFFRLGQDSAEKCARLVVIDELLFAVELFVEYFYYAKVNLESSSPFNGSCGLLALAHTSSASLQYTRRSRDIQRFLVAVPAAEGPVTAQFNRASHKITITSAPNQT